MALLRSAFWLVVLSAFALTLLQQGPVLAQAVPPAEEVTQGVDDLDRWLPDGPIRKGWRDFLHWRELRQQLESRDRPDAGVLKRILARYQSRTSGLEKRRFARVRQALQRWLGTIDETPPESLPALVGGAKGQFHAFTESDVEHAREELRKAYADLEKYMVPGSKIEQAWREILLSPMLEEGLAHSGAVDVKMLEEVSHRYHGADPALALPKFQAVADRLDDFLASARVAQDINGARNFDAVLTALEDRLGKRDEKDDRERNIAVVGRAIDWLDQRRQLPEMVTNLRGRLSRPNLYFYVSSDIVDRGSELQVNRVAPIRDVILGTCINGTGRTIGITRFEFVPDPDRAVVDVVFKGVNHARSSGVNGPAFINSRSTTQLDGRKRLIVAETGITEFPAKTTARTRTRITGVGTRFRGLLGRIAQRIASRKVAESKGAAEAVASRHAERTFNVQMNREAGPRIAEGNHALLHRFRDPLARRRVMPHLQFRTGDNRFYVAALETAPGRLGAQSEPPPFLNTASVGVRLHESIINNAFFGLFAGRTLDNEGLEATMVELLGKVPEGWAEQDSNERWSITFDPDRPLVVQFNEDKLEVVMRGTKYTRNDEAYEAMNVGAEYKISQEGGILRLVRQGDLEILPPKYVKGSRSLGLRQTTLRNMLRRRFNEIFKPEIDLEGFALPGAWAKAGTLVATEFGVQNGWLKLAWKADPTRPPTAPKLQTPGALTKRKSPDGSDHVAAR